MLSQRPNDRQTSYFLSHGASGDWFVVQEPFRRRQLESLLRCGRRVLLVQTGGEHYLPAAYLVTDVWLHTTWHRWAVTVRGEGFEPVRGEGFEYTDLLLQVPGSSYLVSAV